MTYVDICHGPHSHPLQERIYKEILEQVIVYNVYSTNEALYIILSGDWDLPSSARDYNYLLYPRGTL